VGENSEIGPEWLVSMVKAVGGIRLVRKLLIACYMTWLVQVHVQYSEFMIPFMESR